ncbi:unnamed protein product, partial [Didymodactylos carnosus]
MYEEEGQHHNQSPISTKIDYTSYWVDTIDYCSFTKSNSDNTNIVNSIPRGTTIEKLVGPNHDTYPNKEHSWTISNGTRQEHIIVRIKTLVYMEKIYIYEDFNPGSVVKLEIIDNRDNGFVLWEGEDRPLDGVTHRIFSPVLRRYRIMSDRLRITVDPTKSEMIAINAIKITGTNIFDSTVYRTTLSDALSKLFNNNNRHSDIQFTIDDHLIKAHKNILCARSSYFRALILNDMREKELLKQGPLSIADVKYDAFVEILYFLY